MVQICIHMSGLRTGLVHGVVPGDTSTMKTEH